MPAPFISVKVVNLSQSVRAIERAAPGTRKAIGGVIRVEAKAIKAEAFSRSRATPGVQRRSYPFGRGAYTAGATATKGTVGINSGAAKGTGVFGAEFGAHAWHIPRGNVKGRKARGIGQAQMRRRTFPVWRGNSTTVRGSAGPGWIMLPVLRKRLPEVTERLEKAINDVLVKAAKAAGVRKIS